MTPPVKKPEEPIIADTWTGLDAHVRDIEDALRRLPAPPTPDDNWSEKINRLKKDVEGLREQLASKMEQEELNA